MDIVLEVFDTFLFDRLYAELLPAFPSHQFAKLQHPPSSTFSSVRQSPTAYQYEPASAFLSFEPSDFAYMSRWPRNNICRQAISLYAITAYVASVILAGPSSTDMIAPDFLVPSYTLLLLRSHTYLSSTRPLLTIPSFSSARYPKRSSKACRQSLS